jgi:predicted transposase YdaD
MIDHDRLFKELLRTFFVEFIELFFPEVHAELDPTSIEFLEQEIFTDVTSGEKHRVDLAVKARLRGQDWYFLFHIEPQSSDKGSFPPRMFRYFARLTELHAIPVYPIALFTYKSPLRPEPNFHRVEIQGWTVLEFHFRVIQLNRLHWRDFLRHKNPVASALMAKMKMTRSERKQVKTECLRLMATLRLNPAKMQLIAGFVDTYLRLEPEEETWVREEIEKFEPKTRKKAMQIVTTWEQQGREIGRKEGLQQGLQQGEANLVIRQLTSRFGKLSPRLEKHICALPLEQLELLGEALLDFTRPVELRNWLDAHK